MTNWFYTALIASGILLIPAACYAQKVDYYESHWQEGPAPDGGEGFIDRMQSDSKGQFMFYFSNDENNLYITLIVAEKASLQKIMRYGLTTWFNPDAKHKKGLGIQFPVPPGEGSGPPARKEGQAQGERRDMMMALMAAKNKEMILIGFPGKGIRDTIQPFEGGEFFARLEMMDREKIKVSLTIPFSKIESAGKGLPDNVISVGFETGYMDLNRQGVGQTGGDQPAQGGGHGGGMYGGPPSSGGGLDKEQGSSEQSGQVSIAELSKPTRLWISEVKLATK